jgi:hypothetical protein
VGITYIFQETRIGQARRELGMEQDGKETQKQVQDQRDKWF